MTAPRLAAALVALFVLAALVPPAERLAASAFAALLLAAPFLLLARFLARGGHRGGVARLRAAEARQAAARVRSERAHPAGKRRPISGDVIDRDGTVVRRAGR